jgi:hypothetical protein
MIPYTYFIKWTNQNKWYYGVRYAKDCSPSDFWVEYKTSSKHVKEFVQIHGDPDVIEIRKTFNTAEKARCWEERVLKRTGARYRDDCLNKTDFPGMPPMLGEDNPMKKQEIALKCRDSRRDGDAKDPERAEKRRLVSIKNAKKATESIKGKEKSTEHKEKLSNSLKKYFDGNEEAQKRSSESGKKRLGKKDTTETKALKSSSHKKYIEENNIDMGTLMRGKKRTTEDKQKKSEAAKQRWANERVLYTCKHCGIETILGNIKRWHDDNCKQLPDYE